MRINSQLLIAELIDQIASNEPFLGAVVIHSETGADIVGREFADESARMIVESLSGIVSLLTTTIGFKCEVLNHKTHRFKCFQAGN